MIDLHYINTLRSLLRLSEKTPRSVIFFLAGSLPASALIHMRQLSLFAMICRLQGNILYNHALNFFTSKTKSPKSWFNQVRSCCLQYGLPHPLDLLEISPYRVQFKRMVKKKVIDYWEVVLREESKPLNFEVLTFLSPILYVFIKSPTTPLFSWLFSGKGRYGCCSNANAIWKISHGQLDASLGSPGFWFLYFLTLL